MKRQLHSAGDASPRAALLAGEASPQSAENGYRAPADTSPELVIAEGIDMIDASNVKTDLLCHSYVSAATSILADTYALLDTGQPPGWPKWRLT